MSHTDPDVLPPPGRLRIKEALYLAPRLARGFGHLNARGPSSGIPTLVLPGFIATDRTTMELRRAFGEGGYLTFPWALGLNLGARDDTIDRLRKRLDQISPNRPALVVGWSLGGLFARELARHAPDRVFAVVTLGSPFSGDPRSNNVWRLYEWIAGHSVDDPPVPRVSAKPPVPTLAFWSRGDGIVSAASARGQADETDLAVEMDCTHMGFGVSQSATRRVVDETTRFLDERGLLPLAEPRDPPVAALWPKV